MMMTLLLAPESVGRLVTQGCNLLLLAGTHMMLTDKVCLKNISHPECIHEQHMQHMYLQEA